MSIGNASRRLAGALWSSLVLLAATGAALSLPAPPAPRAVAADGGFQQTCRNVTVAQQTDGDYRWLLLAWCGRLDSSLACTQLPLSSFLAFDGQKLVTVPGVPYEAASSRGPPYSPLEECLDCALYGADVQCRWCTGSQDDSGTVDISTAVSNLDGSLAAKAEDGSDVTGGDPWPGYCNR